MTVRVVNMNPVGDPATIRILIQGGDDLPTGQILSKFPSPTASGTWIRFELSMYKYNKHQDLINIQGGNRRGVSLSVDAIAGEECSNFLPCQGKFQVNSTCSH